MSKDENATRILCVKIGSHSSKNNIIGLDELAKKWRVLLKSLYCIQVLGYEHYGESKKSLPRVESINEIFTAKSY